MVYSRIQSIKIYLSKLIWHLNDQLLNEHYSYNISVPTFSCELVVLPSLVSLSIWLSLSLSSSGSLLANILMTPGVLNASLIAACVVLCSWAISSSSVMSPLVILVSLMLNSSSCSSVSCREVSYSWASKSSLELK